MMNDATNAQGWRLAARLARRELRGGLKGFRIFLACLTIGVAAIAAVGSVSQSVTNGITSDARNILGGDISVRLIHRPAEPEQIAAMQENARISETMTMRAMARHEDSGSNLIELKSVDANYPLYGEIELEDGAELQAALAQIDGIWGVVIEPNLIDQLDISIGSLIGIGEATFEIRGIIAREPDRLSSGGFSLGPRAMIATGAMAATELVQPGSLITYNYRIRLAPEIDPVIWGEALAEAFPEAGWRIRNFDDAAPGLSTMVERVTLYLTFVGLTALLVGGVGVANAVRAYLEGKIAVIATFKSLGASTGLIFRIYLLQIMAIALLGIALGLVIGALAPVLGGDLLSTLLPVPLDIGFHFRPLAVAALFGLLTALAFAIWPVAQAGEIPAATLFRNLVAPTSGRPRPAYILATAAAGFALVGFAIATADNHLMAVWFTGGALGALVLFRICGAGIMRAARALPRVKSTTWRFAIANLHRPGAPTPSIVMSLGLGLAVLVAITLIEGNFDYRLREQMPETAPSFFFVDIQSNQLAEFKEIADTHAGVTDVQTVPMLRGRIAAIRGVRAQDAVVDPDASWALSGDRGITWSAEPVENSEVVEGEWWAADYHGPTLISFGAETASGLGLGIGDTLTVNILGREIQGEIANLRQIEWGTLGINFLMVFSPGILDGAPQTHLATVYAEEDAEAGLQSKIVNQFANISAVRVRDAIETVGTLIGRIALALQVSALTTLLAGILVLGGAIAAGQRRRIYEAVILKVLGASRMKIIQTFAIEFGLLGFSTALIALGIGTLAAWAVVTQILEMEWIFLPQAAVVTIVASIAVTLGLGLAGTYRALSQKAAPLLRNE